MEEAEDVALSLLTGICHPGFNVSAPEHSSTAPAFNASCAGTGVGAAYQKCDVPQADPSETHILQLVSARLDATNETDSGAHLVVSYQIDNGTAYVVAPAFSRSRGRLGRLTLLSQ